MRRYQERQFEFVVSQKRTRGKMDRPCFSRSFFASALFFPSSISRFVSLLRHSLIREMISNRSRTSPRAPPPTTPLPRIPRDPIHPTVLSRPLQDACPASPIHETLNNSNSRQYTFSPSSTSSLASSASIVSSSYSCNVVKKNKKKPSNSGRISNGFGSFALPLGMYDLNRMTRDVMLEERGMKRRRVGGNWEEGVWSADFQKDDETLETSLDGRKGRRSSLGSRVDLSSSSTRSNRRTSLSNLCNNLESALRAPLLLA